MKKLFIILKVNSIKSIAENIMKIIQVDFYTPPSWEPFAKELENVDKAIKDNITPIMQMPNRNCFLSIVFFAFCLVEQLRLISYFTSSIWWHFSHLNPSSYYSSLSSNRLSFFSRNGLKQNECAYPDPSLHSQKGRS